MKARLTTTINIDAPPEQVFAYLAELKYHPKWNPALLSVQPITRLAKGTEYRSQTMLFNMKLKSRVRVTHFANNKRIDLESMTGMLEYKVSFRLAKDEAGTLVVCDTRVSSQSKAFAFAKPMMQLLAKRELQTDLQALKVLSESGAIA